jgi:Na+/H+ antiporter
VDNVAFFETILLLVFGAGVLSIIAERIDVPPAIILLLGGAVVGFFGPAMSVTIQPDVVLVVLIPPLLMSSAFYTAWRDFREELVPIMSLAVGAVVCTTAMVALAARWASPSLPWGACIALGAIVSPSDAVAAKALLHRLPLPERLVTILEGESLVNDATGLVIYRFAVIATTQGAFHPANALITFPALVLIGLFVGTIFGIFSAVLFRRLGDPQLVIVVTFLSAWASYIVAERAHGSGVLSVVACGLIIGVCQHKAFDAAIRIKATATWDVMVFVLESLVFVLIGLSLHGVVGRLTNAIGFSLFVHLGSEWKMILAVFVAVTLSRLLWAWGAMAVPASLATKPAVRSKSGLDFRSATFVGWAGMRGVVSLAAALALAQAFPQRDLLVFTTFCLIFATVVLQGLTLGFVARILKLRSDSENPNIPYLTALEARALTFRASISELEAIDLKKCGGNGDLVLRLIEEYKVRADSNGYAVSGEMGHVRRHRSRLNLALTAVVAARRALVKLHDDGQIKDAVLHKIESELDLEEFRLRLLLGP